MRVCLSVFVSVVVRVFLCGSSENITALWQVTLRQFSDHSSLYVFPVCDRDLGYSVKCGSIEVYGKNTELYSSKRRANSNTNPHNVNEDHSPGP